MQFDSSDSGFPIVRQFLFAAGVALVLVSLLVPSAAFETLAGRQPGSLSWGPALFRALMAFHGMVMAVFALRARGDAPRPLLPRLDARTSVALALAGAVALALRLWRLESCLWFDEILTMVDYARAPLGRIFTSFPNQNQHMLYSVLSHASMRILGESAFALRLPSVLFGVCSIGALFLLARKLLGDKEALAASALMTLSYHHIWFSQNARGYMGLLLFATLATWLWLEAQERNEWRAWLLYAVSAFLGLWIHATMLFVIAGHALIQAGFAVLRHEWRHPTHRKALVAWVLSGTLTAQAQALALPEFMRTAVHEVSMPSEWTNPLWVLAESVRSLHLGFASFTVLGVGAAMVLFGWVDVLRRNPRAGWAMVVPAAAGGAFMLLLSHNLWPRFFFFSMGFALLIVVHGAVSFPQFLARLANAPQGLRRAARWAGAAAAGVLIAASASTIPRCYALPKQDFTGARDWAEQLVPPGGNVVAVGLAGRAYGKYYAPRWEVARDAAALGAFRTAHPEAPLVYTIPIQLKAFHPDLWRAVERDFEIARVFPGTLGGGEVYVCRPRAGRAER